MRRLRAQTDSLNGRSGAVDLPTAAWRPDFVGAGSAGKGAGSSLAGDDRDVGVGRFGFEWRANHSEADELVEAAGRALQRPAVTPGTLAPEARSSSDCVNR